MFKYLSIIILAGTFFSARSQNKYVLFEEFTGAHCANCPMGHYAIDSLKQIYPGLIVVEHHSYAAIDSMWTPSVDTIGVAFAMGAPLGTADRIYTGVWSGVAVTDTYWGDDIQTRLAVSPEVELSMDLSYDSGTRDVSAMITVDVLSDLTSGDYRINLYVLEDSVVGSGNGYDQANIYDGLAGNPFYGMGDPIVGYVHNHVVREILPSEWGQAGIIPSTPTTGQSFNTTINFNLPLAYDQEKVNLVAFVHKLSTDHLGDEVLNATESLLPLPLSVNEINEELYAVYPNPTQGVFKFVNYGEPVTLKLTDALGQVVFSGYVNGSLNIDLSGNPAGVYFLNIMSKSSTEVEKIILD